MNTLWIEFDRWGSFPETVNERAARFLALEVALLAILAIVSGWLWIAPILALGFFLRVWSGPRYELMARGAVWTSAKIFDKKEVPGAPKRFAQLLGFLLTSFASAALVFGIAEITIAALALLAVLALLEAVGGFCLGCRIFAGMIRAGWIPEGICRRCEGWRS